MNLFLLSTREETGGLPGRLPTLSGRAGFFRRNRDVQKIIAIAGLADSFALFAVDSTGFDPLGGWGNLTALGILAVVLIFIVTKMLPDLHQKFVEAQRIFTESLEKMQIANQTILDRINDRNQAVLDKIHGREEALTEAIIALRENCAAVRFQRDDPK